MSTVSKTPISDFDAAVRLLSGDTNVAIYNDLGLPSIYVRRDKGLISDVIEGGADTAHYAFKVNGVEIPAFYMGKYLATVYKGRALSLPFQDPSTLSVAADDRGNAPSRYVTFDNAKIWCEANGAGFHLPTIAEYAWIALLSLKNGTVPSGNNNHGSDVIFPYEKGIGSSLNDIGQINRTLTGSGPAKWNDNWSPDGICDINGNVYEWQGGYRTVDGELQIFPDNDAAMQYAQNPESTLWKAILQDGTLVEPGTDGTLKWDYSADPGTTSDYKAFRLNTKLDFQQAVESVSGGMPLYNIKEEGGVIIPDRLKALALIANSYYFSYYSFGVNGTPYVYMKNIGERLGARGGSFAQGNTTGVFCLNGNGVRSFSHDTFGFRPAFIPEI